MQSHFHQISSVPSSNCLVVEDLKRKEEEQALLNKRAKMASEEGWSQFQLRVSQSLKELAHALNQQPEHQSQFYDEQLTQYSGFYGMKTKEELKVTLQNYGMQSKDFSIEKIRKILSKLTDDQQSIDLFLKKLEQPDINQLLTKSYIDELLCQFPRIEVQKFIHSRLLKKHSFDVETPRKSLQYLFELMVKEMEKCTPDFFVEQNAVFESSEKKAYDRALDANPFNVAIKEFLKENLTKSEQEVNLLRSRCSYGIDPDNLNLLNEEIQVFSKLFPLCQQDYIDLCHHVAHWQCLQKMQDLFRQMDQTLRANTKLRNAYLTLQKKSVREDEDLEINWKHTTKKACSLIRTCFQFYPKLICNQNDYLSGVYLTSLTLDDHDSTAWVCTQEEITPHDFSKRANRMNQLAERHWKEKREILKFVGQEITELLQKNAAEQKNTKEYIDQSKDQNNPWYVIAKKKDEQELLSFISNGMAEVNKVDSFRGYPLLHWAIHNVEIKNGGTNNGGTNYVKILLEKGADPFISTNQKVRHLWIQADRRPSSLQLAAALTDFSSLSLIFSSLVKQNKVENIAHQKPSLLECVIFPECIINYEGMPVKDRVLLNDRWQGYVLSCMQVLAEHGVKFHHDLFQLILGKFIQLHHQTEEISFPTVNVYANIIQLFLKHQNDYTELQGSLKLLQSSLIETDTFGSITEALIRRLKEIEEVPSQPMSPQRSSEGFATKFSRFFSSPKPSPTQTPARTPIQTPTETPTSSPRTILKQESPPEQSPQQASSQSAVSSPPSRSASRSLPRMIPRLPSLSSSKNSPLPSPKDTP